MKLIFSSLIFALALIFVSCGKQDANPIEVTTVEQSLDLDRQLANNPNYIAILEIGNQIVEYMTDFIKSKNLDPTNDEALIVSYMIEFTELKEALEQYRINLHNDIPELTNSSPKDFAALNVEYHTNDKCCVCGRDACITNTTNFYLNNYPLITFEEYIILYNNCLEFYELCTN